MLAVLLMGGSTALADPIVDFNIPMTGVNGQAGAVAYTGGATSFHTTTSLTVDTISGMGTPKNATPPNPPLVVTSGTMDFMTGAFAGSDATHWFFDNTGSSFSIKGKTAATGGAVVTLLSGVFSGTTTVTNVAALFNVSVTAVITSMNASLATYFGLDPTVPYIGSFALIFNGTGVPPGPVTSSGISSGNVQVTPLPAPSSLVLAGCGVFGVMAYGWRRRKVMAGVAPA